MSDRALPPLSVLVVDDDKAIRELLWQWLHRDGHEVVCVACGLEASRWARARRFDVVLTDIVMPDGDGFELIGEFRQQMPDARIVAMSGGGVYLQREACLHMATGLGAHAALAKPFNWEQMRSSIRAALGHLMPAQ